jgi:hypothetical protein
MKMLPVSGSRMLSFRKRRNRMICRKKRLDKCRDKEYLNETVLSLFYPEY